MIHYIRQIRMATILCIDDEPSVGVVLEHTLTELGHRPVLARSVTDAFGHLNRSPVDLIVSDYKMPEATGLDLLAQLERDGFNTPVIMLTGYSSIEHAVLSIKSGAIDYLTKPIRPETLEIAVNQALELVRLRRENETFRRERATLKASREIVGTSQALRNVLQVIGTVAPTRATVLLQGESGTGKELFAHALHAQSSRHDGPFIKLNCAAMPEGLVESALFGHEKGAFTGATARAMGAFERAHKGSLMLDEVSEMRLDLQSKLLRVIQEYEFERVGGQSAIKVDVRLIATTNRDLKKAVEEGKFREDLYYRLNVVPIRTPPLRERLDDMPLLVNHFIRRVAKESGSRVAGVSPEAITRLQQYSWPGNVRELSNVIERASILSRTEVITPEAFADIGRDFEPPAAVAAPPLPPAGAPAESKTIPPEMFNLRDIEKVMIERALVATGGNRTRAAKLLGISERTLRNKLNSPQPALK